MQTVGVYEAKTHLAQLLDVVQQGGQITITRHGVPVAMLVSPGGQTRRAVKDVVADIRHYRQTLRLKGLSIRKMIEEGRR